MNTTKTMKAVIYGENDKHPTFCFFKSESASLRRLVNLMIEHAVNDYDHRSWGTFGFGESYNEAPQYGIDAFTYMVDGYRVLGVCTIINLATGNTIRYNKVVAE